MTHALAGLSEDSSIVVAVAVGGSYSSFCRLWNAICNNVFECKEHSAYLNSSSAVPAIISRRFLAPCCIKLSRSTWCSENCASGWCQSKWHQRAKQSARSQHWQLWSIFSYASRNSCPSAPVFSEWQSGRDECQSGSNSRRQTSTTQEYKSWSHGMRIVLIQEMDLLKNSSTLAVSVPINISQEKVHYISTINFGKI